MLKSAMKQIWRPLSRYRWLATNQNQKLSKTEGSFANRTTWR